MSFRRFSKCYFYDSFSHCCHCYVFSFFVTFWWFLFMLQHDTWSALVSECKALSWESLNSLRKHFPWCHGATDNMTGGASLHHLSDGYFYINLPPIFMCLLSVVLMYLSSKKKKTCNFTLQVAVLSDQEHMTTKSEPHGELWRVLPLLYLHAAVGERIIVYVSLFQKWLTAHSCVCTLL